MRRIYAEFGIGNDTICSTEIEESDGSEVRLPIFKTPEIIDDRYIRFWAGTYVLILSTKDGFKKIKKGRNKFKFLLGLAGTDRAN